MYEYPVYNYTLREWSTLKYLYGVPNGTLFADNYQWNSTDLIVLGSPPTGYYFLEKTPLYTLQNIYDDMFMFVKGFIVEPVMSIELKQYP